MKKIGKDLAERISSLCKREMDENYSEESTFVEFLETIFDYVIACKDSDCYECSLITNGGIECMFEVEMDKGIEPCIAQLIVDFDIEEEITLHRQDERFTKRFGFSEALDEFKSVESYFDFVYHAVRGTDDETVMYRPDMCSHCVYCFSKESFSIDEIEYAFGEGMRVHDMIGSRYSSVELFNDMEKFEKAINSGMLDISSYYVKFRKNVTK